MTSTFLHTHTHTFVIFGQNTAIIMNVALVLLVVLPSVLCETIILNDLAPEDVQARLAVQSLDLQYAKFLGQRQLPADQSPGFAEGRIAENPEDYLQNSYQANQFHGQDGLGRAMFGYSDWNQGRLEARNQNGDVRGSYQYVDAFGDNVIVNYWADSLGFHHTDNRKSASIEQVTETPEVQAARLAHQRAWDAAAKAAQQTPDPMSDIYNANANRLDEERSEYEQVQQILAQQQIPNQYNQNNLRTTSGATVGASGQLDSDTDAVLVQTAAESRRQNQYKRVRPNDLHASATEDQYEPTVNRAEINGPPHGFFYSVDYPVQVVVENPESIARRLAQRQSIESASTLLRRPTIVAPQLQYQQLQLKQQQQQLQPLLPLQPTIVDSDDEDSVKIVPIRILDTKKFKRSDQSNRRRQAAIRNRFQRQSASSSGPTGTTVAATTKATPTVHRVSENKPTVAARTTTTVPNTTAKSSPSPASSEIIQIKSLAEQQHEQELRRLASNADAVDGVHDAQVHPIQAARIEAAMQAARKYRSYF